MSLLKDFIHLFYPDLCAGCGNVLQESEEYICLHCRYEFPRTHFHKLRNNPVEKIFWGRAPLHAASSYLYFQKGGKVQHLMHQIKYKGIKEAASKVGEWFGEELMEEALFKTVDYIVPVPLHESKLKSRGYNQAEWLGKGLSLSMKKPLSVNNLIRIQKSETQTKKARYTRWENVEGIFAIENPAEFQGKHVMLIDDVVTTGATLEACAQTLIKFCPEIKISIATLAIATH